jgi:hypothetical protein
MTPEELAAKLRAHPFADELEPLMHKITLVALRYSQQRTPVDTGTLRRSETTRVEAGGARGYVGTNVEYGPFVHARVPFFAQGIQASRGDIERLLQQAGEGYWGRIA